MALRYFGVNKGATETTVTQGSSTTSKTVQVVVDLATATTKLEVVEALEKIKWAIHKNIWPPA